MGIFDAIGGFLFGGGGGGGGMFSDSYSTSYNPYDQKNITIGGQTIGTSPTNAVIVAGGIAVGLLILAVVISRKK